jgi:hypothetical protein
MSLRVNTETLGEGNFCVFCVHLRIDKYRFATTTLDSSFNYEPIRWMLEGTNDATAAGGDAYDPYGMIKHVHSRANNNNCRHTEAITNTDEQRMCMHAI